MYQDINEAVNVIALFTKGKITPIKFQWNNKPVKVMQVTGKWKSSNGRFNIRHFTVIDESDNFMQLSYDDQQLAWTLDRIWVDPPERGRAKKSR
ncbi:MAG: hypothetical protein GF315_00180 [candidate division Zixibacteria bacterium]|nr:hypothetical protein [candidate division Zixibacteria bacterium]